MPLPVTFSTLAAPAEPLQLLDTQFAAVAALGVIPCAATGTNAIALTPVANTPTITSYPDLQPSFVFVAQATTTAPATINVSGVGARNAYKRNGQAQCGAGDIVVGGIYRATPLLALNGGAGGFQVDTVGTSDNVATVPFIIDGGGSAITTGAKGSLRIPYAATIAFWSVIADQSGSISVDILRLNNGIPVTSMIGGGNKPTLSSSQFAGLTAPSGWTSTTFAANDWITYSVASAATLTRVTVDLALAKL